MASGEFGPEKRKAGQKHLKVWASEVTQRYASQGKRRRGQFVSDERPEDLGTPCDIRFGDWAKLIGYKVEKKVVNSGQALWVTQHFEVLKPPPKSARLWMHLLGPFKGDKPKRQLADHVPCEGSFPVPEWRRTIHHRQTLAAYPPRQLNGDWELHTGMWDHKKNKRISPRAGKKFLGRPPVTLAQGVHLADLEIRNSKGKAATKRTVEATYKALPRELKEHFRPPSPGPKPRRLPGPKASWGGKLRLLGVNRPLDEKGRGLPGDWQIHLAVMDKLPRHGELFLHVTGPGEKGKKHRNLKLNSPVAKLLHRLTRLAGHAQARRGGQEGLALGTDMGRLWDPT